MRGHNILPPVTLQDSLDHGLSEQEHDQMLACMGRVPNRVELGIFSVMWSEHCSYKSSRHWLAQLPTEQPWVVCGPGENAGVIDIGDGDVAVFKIESHNHPSFIEPYQGAATGVGGILRDVFTMGARPIALMNALRFGAPDNARTPYLLHGVVAGIAGYGNCFGIPTIGGETEFHPAYNGNILVNAFALGIAKRNRLFFSAASGVGNPVLYVGATTGADGVHGATLASAGFDDNAAELRPTVQVGDPFGGKCLMEACLELMQTGAVLAIQDMGAAGLTSSSVEMASKGNVGLELDLDQVPLRDQDIGPYEIMLSESQERMLIIMQPGKEAVAHKIFAKWDIAAHVIGTVTNCEHLHIKMGGKSIVDIPIKPLVDSAPKYQRAYETQTLPDSVSISIEGNLIANLQIMLGDLNLSARDWITEQYDHIISGNVLQTRDATASVIKLPNTDKALAMCLSCTPTYVQAHAHTGAMQAVAQTWRQLIAVGAKPLAITNNLNFANPEHPKIMGQLVGSIEGMKDACNALDFPVISGNVSLYNETNAQAILPTPVIGGVGLIKDWRDQITQRFDDQDLTIFVIGKTDGWLSATRAAQILAGRTDGPPPPIDCAIERKNGECVQACMADGLVIAAHAISGGGVLVALAEVCMANNKGASIALPTQLPENTNIHNYAFGEDQSRYIVITDQPKAVQDMLSAHKVDGQIIGQFIGQTATQDLTIAGYGAISVSKLHDIYHSSLKNYATKTH